MASSDCLHLSSPEVPLSQVPISCHTPEVGLCSLRRWALTSSEVSLCIPGSSSSWILKGSTSRGSFCRDTSFPLLRSLPQEAEGFIRLERLGIKSDWLAIWTRGQATTWTVGSVGLPLPCPLSRLFVSFCLFPKVRNLEERRDEG